MNFQRGFTLLEMLCAAVVSTILLLAVLVILHHINHAHERHRDEISCSREARAALHKLAEELGREVFHKDCIIETPQSTWPSSRLGFLCLQPAGAQQKENCIGDLCAVRYYLQDVVFQGKTTRCLMRGFCESSETFKAIKADQVPSLFESKEKDEAIALDVVSFEALPKSQDPSGAWIDWVKNDNVGPDALDIRIVIARRHLALSLKQSDDWGGKGKAGKLLGNPNQANRHVNLEVYSTRIYLKNHEIP